MRVLLVIGSLRNAGAEQQLLQLARYLDAQATIDVGLLLVGKEPLPSNLDLPSNLSIAQPRMTHTPLGTFTRIRAQVRAADIVYVWLDVAITLIECAAVGLTTPIVWGLRAAGPELSIWSRVARRFNAWRSRKAAAIINNSRAGERYYRGQGYRCHHWHTIANAVDYAGYHERHNSADVRADLGLPEDRQLIGCIARVHPVKNHSLLLQAFADACADTPTWDLVLVGAGTDNDPSLQQDLTQLGLAGRVHRLGEQQSMHRVYAALDAVICASTHEGSPNTVLEALAAGLPVISTIDLDDEQIVSEGGYLCSPTTDDLAKALRKLWSLSANARLQLGANGRRVLEHRYPQHQSHAQTLTLLTQITTDVS